MEESSRRVAFVCVQNAGRSQMAAAFAERERDRRGLGQAIEIRSGGTDPADHIHDLVQNAMAEVGIDISYRRPRAIAQDEIAEVESTLRSLRQDRESALNQKNEAAVQLAEVETRIEDVTESVAADFDRDLADAPVEVPDDFDENEARSEVKSLRGTINALGDVNPLALEEYEEEKERLDFLEEQKADLEEAEETLLETIEEINATAAERFFETFDEIKDSFGDIFTELFGEGATAELQLEDPDDPIDSPIEIIAKPRGKRPVTLDQLSSGEKALTATALLFAIYLVKPSPFCVLDEVDAPLDDANVERFMSLVRRFEGDTQFVLVTHNQRTMALSDRMYGVTMEEQGVSKLVGVEFDEAVELTQ